MNQHRSLRPRMRLTNYPHIRTDETVTIDAIIKGLEHHPTFKHLANTGTETDSVPQTIQQVTQRLQVVQARHTTRQSQTTIDPRDFARTPPNLSSVNPSNAHAAASADEAPREHIGTIHRGHNPPSLKTRTNPPPPPTPPRWTVPSRWTAPSPNSSTPPRPRTCRQTCTI